MTASIHASSFRPALAVRLATIFAAPACAVVLMSCGTMNSQREAGRDYPLVAWLAEEPQPSEQQLIARAIDEHSAAFPAASDDNLPLSSAMTDSIAEHEALIDAWLARR